MKVIYTDKHALHAPDFMVAAGREVPHCEVPQRAERILASVKELGFPVIEPREYPTDPIKQVHSEDYLQYLSRIYEVWTAAGMPAQGVVPDTFPSRFRSVKPGSLIAQTGWFCFDTCAPIVQNTYEAAVSSAWCALTGADLLREGEKAVYSLCRPPGHHAGRDYCGGFCYLNNVAIAARYLLQKGLNTGKIPRIAILDIDYHHGNGTEEIFEHEKQVLFVSIHGDPDADFPFYWGREQGVQGDTKHRAINIPLPKGTDEPAYMAALHQATVAMAGFDPDILLVSFGTDTFKNDPMGSFRLETGSYTAIGQEIAQMGLPTLIVQEGGYNTDELGVCVANFLRCF